jgi:hypothetical protein
MELTRNGEVIMATIPKIVGASSCAFVLCVGLSYAYGAHPQAETKPSNDRGSQGNQELIKGDSTPLKGEEEKVDAAKLKEQKQSAKREFDMKNAKGQQESSDKIIAPKRTLQNKLSDEPDSVRLSPLPTN